MDTVYYYEQANWYKSKSGSTDYDKAITQYIIAINDRDEKNLSNVFNSYYELIWIYLISKPNLIYALTYIDAFKEKKYPLNSEMMAIIKTYNILKKQNLTDDSEIMSLKKTIESDINDTKQKACAGSKYSQYAVSLYYYYEKNDDYSKKFGEMAYNNNMPEAGFLIYNNNSNRLNYLYSAIYHNDMALQEMVKLYTKAPYDKEHDKPISIIIYTLKSRRYKLFFKNIKEFIFQITEDKTYFNIESDKTVKKAISHSDLEYIRKVCTITLTNELFDPFIELALLYLKQINIDTNKHINDYEPILDIVEKYIDDSTYYLGNLQSNYFKLYTNVISYRISKRSHTRWTQNSQINDDDDDFKNNTSSNVFYEYLYFKLKFLNDFKKNPIRNFHNYEHIIQTIHEFISKFKKYNTFIELYILGKLYSYLYKFFHKNIDYFNLSKDYYRLSAEQGYRFACYKMNKIYMNKKNFYPIVSSLINAEEWIKRSNELVSVNDITEELRKPIVIEGGLNYSNHKSKKKIYETF